MSRADIEADLAVLVTFLAREEKIYFGSLVYSAQGGEDAGALGKGGWVHCTHKTKQKSERDKGRHLVLLSIQPETAAYRMAPLTGRVGLPSSGKPFWNTRRHTQSVLTAIPSPIKLAIKSTHYPCLATLSSWAATRTRNGPKRGCRS